MHDRRGSGSHSVGYSPRGDPTENDLEARYGRIARGSCPVQGNRGHEP